MLHSFLIHIMQSSKHCLPQKRIITYVPKAENTLIAAVLKRFFCYVQKVRVCFLYLGGIGKLSHWNQCSPFFTESTALPNCHKTTLFYKRHKIAQNFTNTINVTMQRVKNDWSVVLSLPNNCVTPVTLQSFGTVMSPHIAMQSADDDTNKCSVPTLKRPAVKNGSAW